MKYFSGTRIITLTMAVLVGAAVWPAVSDAPWERSQETKVVTSPTPELSTSPYTNASPQQSDAQRLATAQREAQEKFDSADMPDLLKEALRPSMVAYFLADSPQEKEQAGSEIVQIFLLWEAANRPQSSITFTSPATSGTDWQTDLRIRELDREIDRLRLCINYGVSCY